MIGAESERERGICASARRKKERGIRKGAERFFFMSERRRAGRTNGRERARLRVFARGLAVPGWAVDRISGSRVDATISLFAIVCKKDYVKER